MQTNTVYRSEELSTEDLILRVFHGRAPLADGLVLVDLLAVQKIESPELLHPTALLRLQTPGGHVKSLPAGTRLKLKWGLYQGVAEPDAGGQGTFPPLPVKAVLDAAGKKVIAAVSLSIETPAE